MAKPVIKNARAPMGKPSVGARKGTTRKAPPKPRGSKNIARR